MNRPKNVRRTLKIVAAATLAALTVAACGGGGGSSGSADFNDADVVFAQSMIPHHEQAIEMAEIALDPAVNAGAEVTDLAERIQSAQDPEIKTMKAWLTEWKKPTQMDTGEGHDMSSMEGMMSADEMEKLEAARGAEFDLMWAEMMIEHHEGAISMAEEVQTDGKNADVKELAAEIIEAQSSEIEELQQLVGQ